MDKPEFLTRVAVIFSAFPNASIGSATPEAYWLALKDFPDDALVEAFSNYMLGTAPGQNPAFPPSAPEIATEVRRIISRRVRLASYRALPPPTPEVDEEQRKAMGKKLARLAQKLAKGSEAAQARVVAERREKALEGALKLRQREGEAQWSYNVNGTPVSRSLIDSPLMRKETAPV
jgi:hypothetical protein